VLANNGHADAETEAGAAAGTLGGVKGIEDAGQRFGADADTIILDGDHNLVAVASSTELDAASVTNFADSLLGVGDKVQKDLNELVGVTDDAGKVTRWMEIHLDIIAAEGMFVQLKGALEKIVNVKSFLLRRCRAGEFEKILDDASGTAGLAVRKVKLALGGIVDASALAKEFGNAENSR
jgi:hypothetical protein